jgi:predicted extracellular nuclease
VKVRATVSGLLASAVALLWAATAAASPSGVVISQVYGGGGNSGATHTHDFVELYNAGSAPVSLAGWSIQYTSATGTGNLGATATQLTELSGSIQPGRYLLIEEGAGAGNGAPLPTPDVTDATPIAMSATAGKVALVRSAAGLGCNGGSTPCSAAQLALIEDLVGYGNANFFEGAGAAPTLTNATSAQRGGNGAIDTDNNASDFVAGTPTPRNSTFGERALSIDDVTVTEGNSGTTTATFTVSLSTAAGAGGVTFDIATADGSATAASGDYVAKSLTGQTIPEGSSSYTFDVTVNGDTAFEPDETFSVNVTNVTGSVVADTQGLGTIRNDDVDCTAPFTKIGAIQGEGANAAITGTVTTQGVVVGDFEGSAAGSGFFLQDVGGDGNPATSDGIFVFTGNANTVSAGQVVRVTGFARERFNQTALNGSNSNTSPVTSIFDCGTTTSVAPTDVSMPFASADAPERYEGMLVRLPQALTIAEYFNYDRFGEIVLGLPLDGETRPFTPTSIVDPGQPALDRLLANQLRRITLDDNQSAQNPPVLRHPNGAPFTLANRFRGGDTVRNTVGVLGWDFNLYRIFPTAPADYEATNPRPAAPSPVGGSIRVAAMNTLNYFISPDNIQEASNAPDDPADNICGPVPSLECRGWDGDQPQELSRQRTKLLEALAGLDADVLGLNELENTKDVDPLTDPANGIVPGLNAKLGAGTYAAITTGTIGTDAIKVGLIYRPAKVKPVGSFKLLTSAVDPRFLDTKSRPALAQTFESLENGARFTVVVNHLKSKGSDCNDVGDPDTGDGQGNCNGTRTLAAQALVDWIKTDPTGSGDADFLIMGDLNSYAKEDPIRAIQAGADDTAGTADDWTNLVDRELGTYAYSYVFDGMSGYLDHALGNASIAPQVAGVAEWHINADEPDILDYDTSFKPAAQEALWEPNGFRTSDHDPVIVGLDLAATFADLARLTAEYVDHAGLENSLLAKLRAAQAAAERGDETTKQNILEAFVNELEAQAGKALPAVQAEQLIRIARTL